MTQTNKLIYAVNARLTHDDFATLFTMAKKSGVTVSNYVRNLIRREIGR